MHWRTDSLQITAFLTPGIVQPDALQLWTMLFGTESPDQFQRPAGNPAAISVASGAREERMVSITSQLGRLDLALVPMQSNGDAPPALPDFEGSLNSIVGMFETFDQIETIYRIGLVASFSCSVDRTSISEAFSNIIESVSFPKGSEDCLYQYNIKSLFEFDKSISMNRLNTWASGEQQLISMSPPAGGSMISGQAPFTIKSLPIINWRIDVNSATVFGQRLNGLVRNIVKELAAQLRDMANFPRTGGIVG